MEFIADKAIQKKRVWTCVMKPAIRETSVTFQNSGRSIFSKTVCITKVNEYTCRDLVTVPDSIGG